MRTLEGIEFLGLPVLVAALSSVLMSGALKLGNARWSRCAPAAQARLLMAAAVTPALFGWLFFGAAVAGWLLRGPEEICWRRIHSEHLSALLVLGGITVLARGFAWMFPFVRDLRQAHRILHTSYPCGQPIVPRCRVLPGEEPQAFVLGLFKPEIYVSQGLLSACREEILQPMLAHEQAHVRHHDPLRRLIASVCSLFHMPGIARFVMQELARTQELAADAEAANQIGDPTKVAEALVHFARLRLGHPASAFEFTSGELKARVQQLLRRESSTSGWSGVRFLLYGMSLALGAFAAAPQVHSLAEFLLKLP